MRYKFIILFLLIGFVSKAQVYQLMPQYGYDTKRMNFDSTIQIPTFCGVPKLGSNKINKGALAFDSCNNRFYYFNPKLQVWDTIKSADASLFVKYTDTAQMLSAYLRKTDTISLSNRIEGKIDSLKLSNDSIYARKNGQFVFQYMNDTATVVKAFVRNVESFTINRGQVVYIFGASGDKASVKLADNSGDVTSARTLGIVRESIEAGQTGWVTTQGQVGKLQLGAYNEGDILWLDSIPGGFTKNKPVAPRHSVFLGVVERANNGNGIVYVKPQNGYELGELHDVKITSPQTNEVLAYTTNIWENKNIYSILDTTSLSNRINTKLNISDTSAMLSPYIRTNTANASYVTSVFRKTASDSVFFVRGGTNNFAFRDSLGVGGSPANPTASVGLTAVNGTAGTFMRSDAAPALSQSISPTWTGNHTFNNKINITTSTASAMGVDVTNTNTSGESFINLKNPSGYTAYELFNSNWAAPSLRNVGLFTASSGILGLGFATLGASNIFFRTNTVTGEGNERLTIFGSSGNVSINNITDAGFKFNVNGSSRFQDTLNIINTISNRNNNLRMNSNSSQANVIEFLNSDNSLQSQVVSTGTSYSFGSYRANQINLFGQSGGIGLRTTDGANAHITLYAKNSNANLSPAQMQMFAPTGNVQFQDGGTYTDIASARVAINSTTQGFLQPRMTTSQMNAISTPATGLSVFNTTDSAVYIRRGTGAGWQQIANEIVNTASLNFPSTNAQNSSDLTITLTGAVDGDAVVLGVPNAAVNANSCYTAWVSAANTVTVRFNNYSSGAIDPAQATFRVTIIK